VEQGDLVGIVGCRLDAEGHGDPDLEDVPALPVAIDDEVLAGLAGHL
jgi:hypothetical protein